MLLWGGAAAIASGGFAFMASNTVANSGAGEGVGTVSGYTVSNVKYATHDPGEPGGPKLYTVTSVSFKLSVPSNVHHGTPAFTTAPTQVLATLLDDHGQPLNANSQGANPATCKATGPAWNSGSGNYICYFTKNGNAPGPGGVDNTLHVHTVTGLDVEANQ